MATARTSGEAYSLACRVCLRTDAEFYKLDTYFISDIDETRISLMACLLKSLGMDDEPQLPRYICINCSRGLQLTYFFMRSARAAHEILCRALCPQVDEVQLQQRQNGLLKRSASCLSSDPGNNSSSINTTRMEDERAELSDSLSKMSLLRCRTCGLKLGSKQLLREHMKTHMNLITYPCDLCIYVTHSRSQLGEHYRVVHKREPVIEQSKSKPLPLPLPSPTVDISTPQVNCTFDDLELFIPNSMLLGTKPVPPQTPLEVEKQWQEVDEMDKLVKEASCTVSDAFQIATVISDPNDLSAIASDLDSSLIVQNMTTSNENSVGTEFMVLPDGTVQEVVGNGVLIEYINAEPSETDASLLKDDINTATNLEYKHVDMDLGNMILNDINEDTTSAHKSKNTATKQADTPRFLTKTKAGKSNNTRTISSSSSNLQHICSVCNKKYTNLNRLRTHLLSHNDLPKYFCDQCGFYTLLSSDLISHYEVHHKSHLPHGQLNSKQKGASPKGKRAVAAAKEMGVKYSCDSCLFETRVRSELKEHYIKKHKVRPSEVQLRPEADEDDEPLILPRQILHKQMTNADYKDGIRCARCGQVFYWRSTYKEHLKQHLLNENSIMSGTATATHIPTDKFALNFNAARGNLDTSPNSESLLRTTDVELCSSNHDNTLIRTTTHQVNAAVEEKPNVMVLRADNRYAMLNEMELASSTSAMPTTASTPCKPTPTLSTTNDSNISQTSVLCDMQDFIDSTDVAAICTIPADAIQVVESDDIVIDSNNITFDFNTEAFFDGFEEDVDDYEYVEGTDYVEDDDENENNDAANDQNLLLTSDEDDIDDYDDEQSKNLQKPYCSSCHRKFTSQYQFENHMFVHRGLAPYRCELCTNLYNVKRALIRHYKAVHKRMPTRDMVQAKGDKLTVGRTSIETLVVNTAEASATTYMCAKCPYECYDESDVNMHLALTHGIADVNYIIRKLPYECPRCIRSFAAKQLLARHLQRSHMVATIIEQTAKTENTNFTSNTAAAAEVAVTSYNNNNVNENAANRFGGVGEEAEDQTEEEEAETEAQRQDIFRADSKNNTDVTKDDNDDHYELKGHNGDVVMPTQSLSITPTRTNTTTTTMTTAAQQTSTSTAFAADLSLFLSPTRFGAYEPFADYDFIDHEPSSTISPNHHHHSTTLRTSSTEATAVAVPHSDLITPTYGLDNVMIDEVTIGGCADLLQQSPSAMVPHNYSKSPIFVCKICNNFTCDALDKLNQHTASHSGSGGDVTRNHFTYECHICQCTYKTITLLKYHMKRHWRRHYECTECPKTFIAPSELEAHRRTHNKMRLFKCDEANCNKAFGYKHHLKRHKEVAHLLKRYTCPLAYCGRQMTTLSQLRHHMMNHKGALGRYKCTVCQRIFTRRSRLRMHAEKQHDLKLSDSDIAEIFRVNVGYTNPIDLKFYKSAATTVSTKSKSEIDDVHHTEAANAVVNILNMETNNNT